MRPVSLKTIFYRTYHNFIFMAEVVVIAHTKTNLLDSVLKSSVSSGIAKGIIMIYMNLAWELI